MYESMPLRAEDPESPMLPPVRNRHDRLAHNAKARKKARRDARVAQERRAREAKRVHFEQRMRTVLNAMSDPEGSFMAGLRAMADSIQVCVISLIRFMKDTRFDFQAAVVASPEQQRAMTQAWMESIKALRVGPEVKEQAS